jgi:acyl dehydratase
MPDHISALSPERYFEDYQPGAVFEFGSAAVTEDSIVAFASQYDPQEMHTDREWAKRGPFGGLIASGWQTVGIMMRLYAEHYLPRGGLASPGIDELRWPHPVRPRDTLRVRVTVQEARLSRSKPDRGMVRSLVEVLNQNDEVVLSLRPMNLVRCRPESLASAG